ncbi:MAG TPA: flagellar motor protein MotB [Fimbriimonadaceae bacterium]|nr:flagellar motor protein MotB [Fimbriimonadaceae bacterium]
MSDNTPIIVKKKKIIAAGHHGGSWKVAYADFVTAMMAFFMVMWIMGMSAETRSMVAGYFNDPLGFMKNPPKSRSPFATPGSPNPKPTSGTSGPSEEKVASEQLELKEIANQFQEALAKDVDLKELSKHVQVDITEKGLRIELMESAGAVFFESGRDVIRPQAMQLISKIGPILGRSGRPIIVEGHTDAAPYPSTVYSNWELSSDRATSMRQALTRFGVPLKQFVEVRGFADKQLKNPGNPLHFSNRRVTVFLPFTREIAISDNLPKDALKHEIQGVFKKPVEISPPPKVSNGGEERPFFG